MMLMGIFLRKFVGWALNFFDRKNQIKFFAKFIEIYKFCIA